MSLARTFIAIPLDESLKQKLASVQSCLDKSIQGIRWSTVRNLHLTLHFLGEMKQENLEKIKASMLSVKSCSRAFEVEVKGLGGFPKLRRSRVLWLGLTPEEPLITLHRDVGRLLRDAGISTDERPYTPHLTLGRARHGILDLSRHRVTLNDTAVGHLVVDRMVLYQSRLLPHEAIHDPLFTVNFDEKNDSLS